MLVEGIPAERHFFDRFLRAFALAALASNTMAVKRRAELAATGNVLRFFVKVAVAQCVAGRQWSRSLLRSLERLRSPSLAVRERFERYQPSLLFSTDIQHESDLQVMSVARERRVPIVGMIRSWDTLTTKGILRIVPDLLVVHNEIIRREAVILHGVPEEIIRVVGVPHYDRYGREPVSRGEFFRSFGFDPGRRLVLVAPFGDRYICEFGRGCANATDRAVLEILLRAGAEGAIPRDLQFLVRLPPSDRVNLEGFVPPLNVVIHQPGIRLGDDPVISPKNELSVEDDELLRQSLASSDLIIAATSTIAIDAAIFDKPVILVAFDGERPRPYYESVRRYYDGYNHLRPIVRSNGARLARNPAELIKLCAQYLDEPALDREGREIIRREQCFKLDGRSTERLTAVIRGALSGSGGFPPLR